MLGKILKIMEEAGGKSRPCNCIIGIRGKRRQWKLCCCDDEHFPKATRSRTSPHEMGDRGSLAWSNASWERARAGKGAAGGEQILQGGVCVCGNVQKEPRKGKRRRGPGMCDCQEVAGRSERVNRWRHKKQQATKRREQKSREALRWERCIRSRASGSLFGRPHGQSSVSWPRNW